MAVFRARKRPVEVKAMLYDGSNADKVCAWVNSRPDLVAAHRLHGTDQLIIPTLEKPMVASLGDYIIRGVKGEFYPCKPDIFQMTYDVICAHDHVGTAIALCARCQGATA